MSGNKATLLLTVPLSLEYESVCCRAEDQFAAALSENAVSICVDAVVAMAQPVETHFRWRPQLRDPNDEMVLEAAINGHADVLVTFNVRDFGRAPAQFGVRAVLPKEVIGRMR